MEERETYRWRGRGGRKKRKEGGRYWYSWRVDREMGGRDRGRWERKGEREEGKERGVERENERGRERVEQEGGRERERDGSSLNMVCVYIKTSLDPS